MLSQDNRNYLYKLTQESVEKSLTNLSKDLASNLMVIDNECQKANNEDLALLQEQSKQLGQIAKVFDSIISKYYKLIMKKIGEEIKNISQ